MAFVIQISRKFSKCSSLMLRQLSKRSNPGLGHQITEIQDATKIIQNDPEGLDGLESDLFNAHKSLKQHEIDVQRKRQKIRQFIVKKKYFRQEPLPNLLTFSEKEQIKFLHASDKEEWTPEKLAESFPASTDTIYKILKSQWNPMSSKRILSHDAGVLRNWERFKNGEYNEKISKELQEHLKKFVDREKTNLNVLRDPKQVFQKKQWQKPKSNEFFSLISQPQSNKNGDMPISDVNPRKKIENASKANGDDDTYLLGQIQNKKPMRIQDLKEMPSIKNTESCTKKTNNSLVEEVAQKVNNANGTGIIQDKKTSSGIAYDYTEKFISNDVVISEEDRKRYGISGIKGRIHIPRKLWKRGATYRSNDCYYDDDGEFLYRVPGMDLK